MSGEGRTIFAFECYEHLGFDLTRLPNTAMRNLPNVWRLSLHTKFKLTAYPLGLNISQESEMLSPEHLKILSARILGVDGRNMAGVLRLHFDLTGGNSERKCTSCSCGLREWEAS